MARTRVFDEHLEEYEAWFVKNKWIYLSELQLLQKVIPKYGKGFEIGMGSGLFAEPLGIQIGIEPSAKMRNKSLEKGLQPIDAVAENLPFPDNSFDFALMVTSLCFLDDATQAFQQVYRVIKNNGYFIIAFIDKNSPIGLRYEKNKAKSMFYKEATFFGADQVMQLLEREQFHISDIWQTLFDEQKDLGKIQQPQKGFGKGSFVVIKAKKPIRTEKDL